MKQTVSPNSSQCALVAFNARLKTGALRKSYRLDGFGKNGEAWLLYPKKIDLASDTLSVEARVRFKTLAGHNGLGFISVEGKGRKGYMLLTCQNIKNSGTTGGAGGQSLNAAFGSFTWETSKNYILKSEISGGLINHYVYDEERNLLALKTGTRVNKGHANTDNVYAAAGGTDTKQAVWSDIIVTCNNTRHVIDSLLPQKILPAFSVAQKTLRLRKGETVTLRYTAAASGGRAAGIIAAAGEVIAIEKIKQGKIAVRALAPGMTKLRLANAAVPSLKEEIAVYVLEFPQNAICGVPAAYPAPGAVDACTDGELRITFDNKPELLDGGTIWIHHAKNGRVADVITFKNERQKTLSTQDSDIFTGNQLSRVEGNSVFFTPHFEKLKYKRHYYIAIPKNSIRAVLNGREFNGLPDNKKEAVWKFTTKAPPVLHPARALTVDGAENSAADFRTVYGALCALAAKNGAWQINTAPGLYRELVHYEGRADISIVGQGKAPFGRDVVLQYTNCSQMNGAANTRPVFYFSGANLTLQNITLKNTAGRSLSRTGVPAHGDTQAEALNFAGGADNTLTAKNCSFISRQDTVQTSGRNWFYQCYIEGDTDFIWGSADVCLLERCTIVSVNDPRRMIKESYILAARTGSIASKTVPKGYVILNSRIRAEDGMTLFFGRNAGGSGFYDQCAIINNSITLEGNARLGPAIWKNSPCGFIPGAAEHAGWKVYSNTVNGLPLDTGAMLPNAALIPAALYETEYSERKAILNRVYDKSGVYRNSPDWWEPTC